MIQLLSLALFLFTSSSTVTVSASPMIQGDATLCPFNHLHNGDSKLSASEMATLLSFQDENKITEISSFASSSTVTDGKAGDEPGLRTDKSQVIMKLVTYDTTPVGAYNPLGIFFESMSPSVDALTDVMPPGRAKDVHSLGAVATAQLLFTPDINTRYTGIFASNSSSVILRLSSAADPANKAPVPSIGLKTLRDNVHSGNAFFIGISSNVWNYFATVQQTHIYGANSSFATRAVQAKFGSVTKYPAYIGLADLATYDESGVQASTPVAPFQLFAVPNPILAAKQLQPDGKPFTNQFNSVEVGTELYTIYIQAEPFAEPEIAGSLVLTSPLTTSKYGDSNLFYRHEIFDHDVALRPEWQAQCPGAYDCDYVWKN